MCQKENECGRGEEPSNSTASVSLRGHFGSMRSWICAATLLLSVFLSRICPSEGGCYDYFDINHWIENLTHRVPIIETSPKDVIVCSLKKECQKGSTMNTTLWAILSDCFNTKDTTGAECERNISKTVPLYAFRCLLADAANVELEECDLKATCELYPLLGHYQTSTLSPTTTPRTTLPERTTATTTLPPTTTLSTTATLSPTATLLPTTTTLPEKTASRTANQSAGTISPLKNQPESQLQIFLTISVCLNLLLPLGVYLYMRRQRNVAASREWINGTVLNGGSPESAAQSQPEMMQEAQEMLEMPA